MPRKTGFWDDVRSYFREGADHYQAQNESSEKYSTTATQKALRSNFGIEPSQTEVLASDEITSWTRRSVLRVVRLMAQEHGVEIRGPGGEGAKWIPFRLGEVVEQVPTDAQLAFPAGTLAPCPLLVQLQKTSSGQTMHIAYNKADPRAAQLASAAMTEIFARATGVDNPYRNRTVLASRSGEFEVLPDFADRRSDLVLSEQAWGAVDNIHKFLEKLPVLSAAGLSQNRGLLMAGPPGTGKTALTRIIAGEFAGDATAVLVENGVSKYQLTTLYRVVGDLSPAVVLLEDLDLIAGNRQSGDNTALRELLTVLDGLMTTHKGVVTVASTNDIDSIDAAARRAARFDEILEVPHPDRIGRRKILDTYLRRLGVETIATDRVAGEIRDNLSGADLRLIVNEATLSDALTTDGLIKTAERIFPKPAGGVDGKEVAA